MDQITQEVVKRNESCRINGINYEYHHENPYQYKTQQEFIKQNPFNVKKNCTQKTNLTKKDMHGRIYPNVQTKQDCAGVWVPTSQSRKSKYGRGVCWVDKHEQECGDTIDPNVLIPGKATENVIQSSRAKCSLNPKCAWVKTIRSHDCVMKKTAKKYKKEKDVEAPPSDPLPTDPSSYLYDWYSKKMHNNPPPRTTQLIGKGNRCSGPGASLDAHADDDAAQSNRRLSLHDLKKMQFPLSKHDKRAMKRAIGSYNVELLENAYKNMMVVLADEDEDEAEKVRMREQFTDHEAWSGDLYLMEDDEIVDEEDHVDEFLPSIPQSIVNMIMKNVSVNNGKKRGMLAWHSTGSGKTCTATGCMDAMWDSNRQIIFASSIDAIASNPDYKFHECAVRLFPRFKNPPYGGSQDVVNQAFVDRGIIFVSFAKLANRIEKTEKLKKLLGIKDGGIFASTGVYIRNVVDYISDIYGIKDKTKIKKAMVTSKITSVEDFADLDNSLLIVDEVHNLFRPLANQKAKHQVVEHHVVDPKKHPNLKIVILSATPGDNIPDVMKLLNMVRDAEKPVIRMPNVESKEEINGFKESIAGIVSFFDMSYDVTQFPRVIDNDPIKFPMHPKQFEKYVESYKDAVKAGKGNNYEQLAKNNQLAKFWAGPRKYSNMMYTFDKTLQLTEVSSKLPPLLANIQKFDKDKHYVYSAFYENRGTSQGILQIAKELEKSGYKQFTVKDAIAVNAGKLKLDDGKRFILAIQNEIGKNANAGKNLNEMIKVFNASENALGNRVGVFLASQGFNEGIDLKGVRHIHMFEPLVTMASDIQTIGRARRYCSHSDLAYDKWDVQIHRYMSDIPIAVNVNSNAKMHKELSDAKEKMNELTDKREIAVMKKQIASITKTLSSKTKLDTSEIKNIDQFIFEESRNRMKGLFMLHHSMKEAAVDCKLLREFHNDDSIVCGAFGKSAQN
jgi:hypothetical protein